MFGRTNIRPVKNGLKPKAPAVLHNCWAASICQTFLLACPLTLFVCSRYSRASQQRPRPFFPLRLDLGLVHQEGHRPSWQRTTYHWSLISPSESVSASPSVCGGAGAVPTAFLLFWRGSSSDQLSQTVTNVRSAFACFGCVRYFLRILIIADNWSKRFSHFSSSACIVRAVSPDSVALSDCWLCGTDVGHPVRLCWQAGFRLCGWKKRRGFCRLCYRKVPNFVASTSLLTQCQTLWQVQAY